MPGALDTWTELVVALNSDSSFASTLANVLAAEAIAANPTLAGTVGGISKAMANLASVDNLSDFEAAHLKQRLV